MNYKEIFAQRLKEERIAKGKTMKEMAIALDIARESYLAYEAGKTTPKFENLMKIHEELNISIDYLVGIKDTKETKEKTEIHNNTINNNGKIHTVNM